MLKRFSLILIGLSVVCFLPINNSTGADRAEEDLCVPRPATPITILLQRELNCQDDGAMAREARRCLGRLMINLRDDIPGRFPQPNRDVQKLATQVEELGKKFFADHEIKPTRGEHQNHLEQVKEILTARIKAGEFDEPEAQEPANESLKNLTGSSQEAKPSEQVPPSPLTILLQDKDPLWGEARKVLAGLIRFLFKDIERRFPRPQLNEHRLVQEFIKLEKDFFAAPEGHEVTWEEHRGHLGDVEAMLTARFKAREFDLFPAQP